MTRYLIEEKPIGPYSNSVLRVVEGSDVVVSKGMLQVWAASPSESGKQHLVISVALDRVLTFKSRSAAAHWDGIDRRARLDKVWDGIERRAS